MTRRDDCNVVVARTFSKAYSLAGLRIGYGVARKDIAEVLNKVREPFNINSLAQVAAIAALEDDDHLKRSVELVLKEKQRLYSSFEKFGVDYVPSRTNFILIDTKRNSTDIYNYLLQKGVIVREMSAWGLDGFIRVNIGLEEENDVFLKFFEEALKEIQEKRA